MAGAYALERIKLSRVCLGGKLFSTSAEFRRFLTKEKIKVNGNVVKEDIWLNPDDLIEIGNQKFKAPKDLEFPKDAKGVLWLI